MITIKETETTLEFSNPVSPGMRVLIFFFGLIPLLAPYELLYKIHWQSYAHPAFLFPLVIVLGALAVSGFFMFFALFAYSRRMHFDRTRHQLIYGSSHTLQPYRESRYGFEQIAGIEIEETEWTDGPTSYSLLLNMQDNSKISIGYFEKRDQAEHYLGLIRTWVSIE